MHAQVLNTAVRCFACQTTDGHSFALLFREIASRSGSQQAVSPTVAESPAGKILLRVAGDLDAWQLLWEPCH